MQLCLFGAALDTGNLGVSALGSSVIVGITRRQSDARLLVFDHEVGRSGEVFHLPSGTVRYERQGAWFSRRLHREESLIAAVGVAAVGLRGHAIVRELQRSTAVMDISGGDSFSDIYGRKRFAQVLSAKWLTLRLGIPLVLLPQTYGPFSDPRHRRAARRVLRGAALAYARDEHSFMNLQGLLGDDFDPTRHRVGVDVAFALPPRRPDSLVPDVDGWLRPDERPVVGINTSGLLCNQPEQARERFGLTADVPHLLYRLAQRLLSEDVRVVLIPHVLGDSAESDSLAAAHLQQQLADTGLQVELLPAGLDAMETKWVISQLDWLISGRMHAAIAALSTATPVCGLAYSDKFRGVFSSSGVEDAVLDLRTRTTDQALDSAIDSWTRRQETLATLVRTSSVAVEAAERQMDEMVAEWQRPVPPAAER